MPMLQRILTSGCTTLPQIQTTCQQQATFLTNLPAQQCHIHRQLTSISVSHPNETHQHSSDIPTNKLSAQLCHIQKQLSSTIVPHPQTTYQHTTNKSTSNLSVQHHHIQMKHTSTAAIYPQLISTAVPHTKAN